MVERRAQDSRLASDNLLYHLRSGNPTVVSWDLRSPAVEIVVAAGIGVAGALLSLLLVDVSLGLHDGFDAMPLRRIGLRLENALPWLPLAALSGLALGIWYRRLLAGRGGPLAVVALYVRPFLHFPLFGMATLLAMVWGVVAGLANGLLERREATGRGTEHLARQVAASIGAHIGLPLWFLMPITVEGAGRGSGWPEAPSRRRLLRALPLLALLFLLFPGMENEDSGERVDTIAVTVAGCFWFADYLLVALLVVPRLRQRSPEAGSQANAWRP